MVGFRSFGMIILSGSFKIIWSRDILVNPLGTTEAFFSTGI